MPTRDDEPAFVKLLENHHQEEELPSPRPPTSILASPDRRRGFWATFFGWPDKAERMQWGEEYKRAEVNEKTITTLWEIKSKATTQKAQISAAVGVQVHRHAAGLWQATEAKRNTALATLQQERHLQETLQEVQELNLPKYRREDLLRKLGRIYGQDGELTSKEPNPTTKKNKNKKEDRHG